MDKGNVMFGEPPPQYVVGKQNAGTPRTYKTGAALERAIIRAGATAALVRDADILVEWSSGSVSYSIAKDGTVDHQLAWDMEP